MAVESWWPGCIAWYVFHTWRTYMKKTPSRWPGLRVRITSFHSMRFLDNFWQEIFIKTLFFWRKMSKRGGRCTHFSYFHLFLVVLNSIFLPVLGRGKVQHKGRRRHFTDAEELKAEMERDRQKNWRVNEADFLILLLWYFTHRGILRCFMLFIVSLRFRFYHIICMMQSNTFLKQGNSLFSSYWK